MKSIKVFARKLSLMLTALILALVMIPSDFAFAEVHDIRIESNISLDGRVPDLTCPPSVLEFPSFSIKKSAIGADEKEFTFNIKAWVENKGEYWYTINLYGWLWFKYGVATYGLSGPDQDGVFEFKLKNNESANVSIEHNCPNPDYAIHYKIWEKDHDGWALESINDDKNLKLIEGSLNIDDIIGGDFIGGEYVFENRKIEEEEPAEEEIDQGNTSTESSSEPGVPNTGENTSSFSATRTGIIAFSIIATFGRVIYLIQKNKR